MRAATRPWLGGVLLCAALAPTPSAAEPPPPERLEAGAVPALAFDSDVGLGFGALGSLARFADGVEPYSWRLQTQLFVTARPAPGGGLELPFHDHYVGVDAPGLFGHGVRPSLRLGYGRFATSGYYGLGNAAPLARAALEAAPRYHSYAREQPSLLGEVRLPLSREHGALDVTAGVRLAHSATTSYRGSLLAADLGGAADPVTRALLVGLEDHLLLEGSVGLLFDNRDHETTPTRGLYCDLVLRGGGGFGERLAYAGLRATARGFVPLGGEALVVAARLLGEALLGRPPLYELALGGATSVRGALGQRRHGRAKLLGNLELRAMPVTFTLFGQRLRAGALAFADAGRVWADLRPTRLDGDGLGLLVGLGGGARLQWGEHFLLRADVATSPNDRSTGVYVDLNHVF